MEDRAILEDADGLRSLNWVYSLAVCGFSDKGR